MTLVTDVLTQAQIDQLGALRASLPSDQNIPGKWFPVYDQQAVEGAVILLAVALDILVHRKGYVDTA